MSLLAPLGLATPPIETLEVIETGPQVEERVAAWLRSRGISNGDLLVGLHPAAARGRSRDAGGPAVSPRS